MQADIGGYATNVINIQNLSGWSIQQTQIYSMDFIQKAYFVWLLCFLLTIYLSGFSFLTAYNTDKYSTSFTILFIFGFYSIYI